MTAALLLITAAQARALCPAAADRAAAACVVKEVPSREAPSREHTAVAVRVDSVRRDERAPEPGQARELLRWEGARVSAGARTGMERGRAADAYADMESSVQRTMNSVPWADSHDWVHNPPEILRELRNYRHQGLPIVHLINSAQTVVAFGLSNHGKPGLYFTHKLPF